MNNLHFLFSFNMNISNRVIDTKAQFCCWVFYNSISRIEFCIQFSLKHTCLTVKTICMTTFFSIFSLFLGLMAAISEYPGNSWAWKWYPSTHYIKCHHCSQTPWRWSVLLNSWNQMWQGEKFLRSIIANIISIKRQGKMATENYGEDCNPNRALILIKWPMSQPLLCVKKELSLLTKHFIFWNEVEYLI